MDSTSAGKQPAEIETDATPAPRHLTGNLGTGGLLLTALAFNAPLAVMAGFIPVGIGYGLGAAMPVVYLVVMALMLVFAVGLVTMARHMTKPGAFYSYITAGLGRIPGLGAGFTALTGYILLGAGSYVLAGILANNLVHGFLQGPDLPWWFWAIVFWVAVTTLTLFNIDVSTKVLGVFLCIEVLIVLFWDARVFANGGPHGRALDVTAQLGTGSIGFALLFGVACLTGFESIQVFRTETRDPNRTIPRATYLTVALLAGFYALGSYAYLVGYGTDAAIATAAKPTDSFLAVLGQYAGAVVADIASVMLVTSTFAALLAIQNIVARYSFSLGEDRVLPSALAWVHPRRHAPTRAAAATGGIILVLILIPAVLRVDPTVTYVAMTGLSFWAVVSLLLATALAIAVFFRRHRGLESSAWKTRLAPVLAVLGFGYVLFQATLNSNVLIGGSYAIAIPSIAVIVVVAVGAMIYARWLRSNRPQTWQRIADQDDAPDELAAAPTT